MINKLKTKLAMNKNEKNMLNGIVTLLFGSVSARLIGLISIPVLTRIYSPEDYGVLAIFTAFTTIIATIFGFRFCQAIPLPKNDTMAFNVFALGFMTTIVLSIASLLILGLFAVPIFSFFNAQELQEWWWLVIVAAFSVSVFELFTMWAIRLKSYKLISKIQVKQSLLGEVTKVVIGLAGLKPLGLLLGHFIGQSFGVNAYLKDSYIYFSKEIKRITIRRLLFLSKYYASFAYYRLPSDLFLALSVQAPVIISTKLYDSSTTGQLGLTFMAMALPISLIGAAVSRVYYAEISSVGRHDKPKIRTITIQVQRNLFFMALPVALIIYLFAEEIFTYVFGEQWSVAGLFASILAPYLLLQFISSPLMQLINVLGKQVIFLVLNSGRVFGLVLLYFWASKQQLTPEEFITYLSLFLFLYYFVQLIVIFSLLKK